MFRVFKLSSVQAALHWFILVSDTFCGNLVQSEETNLNYESRNNCSFTQKTENRNTRLNIFALWLHLGNCLSKGQFALDDNDVFIA